MRSKLNPQAEKAGLELVIGGGFDEALVNRDANVILLVLTNLVQNAIQATPRGGQITVNAQRNEEGAAFQVSDTGPGLPSHVQHALFTPCKSTKSGGTGLGLAISKHLANHLGAELCLKQSAREGTTFELRIPERVFAPGLAVS
jgi:signal transduction histidine kinase